MKAIKINEKVTVYDVMGNEYNGAFIPFAISTQMPQELYQKLQQHGQAQNYLQNIAGQSLEELASRGVYTIEYRTFKSKESVTQIPMRTFELCKNNDAVRVGQIVVKLTPEEQKEFSIKTLNQKVLEYFSEIFGTENVELIQH